MIQFWLFLYIFFSRHCLSFLSSFLWPTLRPFHPDQVTCWLMLRSKVMGRLLVYACFFPHRGTSEICDSFRSKGWNTLWKDNWVFSLTAVLLTCVKKWVRSFINAAALSWPGYRPLYLSHSHSLMCSTLSTTNTLISFFSPTSDDHMGVSSHCITQPQDKQVINDQISSMAPLNRLGEGVWVVIDCFCLVLITVEYIWKGCGQPVFWCRPEVSLTPR